MRNSKMLLWILLILLGAYSCICLLVYFSQEKMMFYPEKLPANYRYNFNLPFTERYYEVSETVKLNALHFRTENSKGVVLYFHGNAGSLRNWGSVAGQFVTPGYDLLIFDYRSYGKSNGELSEEALYKDAQRIYDLLKNEYEENKIILFGRSMGTGIAANLASNNNPGMLILETPYYSGKDLAHSWYPWLPTFILKYNFRTDLFLPKVKCPVFLIHGTDDEVVYYESSVKLSKHFKEGDKLFTIEGGHHNDLSMFPEYHDRLREIFAK